MTPAQIKLIVLGIGVAKWLLGSIDELKDAEKKGEVSPEDLNTILQELESWKPLPTKVKQDQ